MNQTQGEFLVAIEHLREDLKEHRAETREDINALAVKTENWQDEVRLEFTDVKDRLTVIETQTATTEKSGDRTWARYSGVLALLISLGLVVVPLFRHV